MPEIVWNGAGKFVLLIQTLLIIWARWIWILRTFTFKMFVDSKLPNPGSKRSGPGRAWAGPGLGLVPGGPSGSTESQDSMDDQGLCAVKGHPLRFVVMLLLVTLLVHSYWCRWGEQGPSWLTALHAQTYRANIFNRR